MTPLSKQDILIPVRDGENNPSLALCLRSIAANFPHRKLWLAGGKPSWVTDDVGHIPVSQGSSPYRNVHNILRTAVAFEGLSEEFTFFNDDFYVMRKVRTLKYMHEGTLRERCRRLERTALGDYTRGAVLTLELLEKAGFEEPLNHDLHVPMPMHKVAVEDALKFIDNSGRYFWPHMRSVYGALIGSSAFSVPTEDVKITTQIGRPGPDETYLSTSLHSLITGSAGWHIRKLFPVPGVYEKPGKVTLPRYA